MRESHIERTVCAYAAGKGFRVYKFSSPGRRGVPDRMFIHSGGQVCFMEFKNAKGRLSQAQVREISRLQETNKVAVISDIDEGLLIIDSWSAELSAGIPAEFGQWHMVLPRSDKIGDKEGRYYVSGIFDREDHANEFCRRLWPQTGEVINRSIRISTASRRVHKKQSHLRSVDTSGAGQDDSDTDFPGSNKATKDADHSPD